MDQREHTEEKEAVALPTPSHKLSRFSFICYGLLALSAILYLCFALSEGFADLLNGTVSAALRATLAYLTGWIPFSLAEYLLILIPVILVALVALGIRYYANTWHDVFVYCGTVLSVVALTLSVFVVGFAPGYHTTPLDRRLGISRREVSAEELYLTAEILARNANAEAERIAFSSETDFSIMPYDVDELSAR